MLGSAPSRAAPAGKTRKGCYGIEPGIIAKPATVLKVEPAELLRVTAVKAERGGCR